LRNCATSRKVAGSIPDGATGGPAIESVSKIEFLRERVKADVAHGRQPYHMHVPIVLISGSLNLLDPSGPIQGLIYLQL